MFPGVITDYECIKHPKHFFHGMAFMVFEKADGLESGLPDCRPREPCFPFKVVKVSGLRFRSRSPELVPGRWWPSWGRLFLWSIDPISSWENLKIPETPHEGDFHGGLNGF